MNKTKSKLSRFIRALWRSVTVTRHFIGNLLFLLVIILLISIFLFDTTPKVPKGSALILSPGGNIVEQKTGYVPLDLLFGRVAEETHL